MRLLAPSRQLLAWSLVAAGCVAVGIWLGGPPGHRAFLVNDGAALGLLAVAWFVRRRDGIRTAPFWLLVAASTWAVGDAIWDAIDWSGHAAPFPSPVDALYLSGYIFVGLAFVAGWRHLLGALLDSAIVGTCVGMVLWAVVLDPANAPNEGASNAVVGMLYPTLDLIVLAMLVQLTVLRWRERNFALIAYTIGTALFLVSDSIYSRGQLLGTYGAHSIGSAGWLLLFALWAAASVHPSAREMSSASELRMTNRRLSVLGASTLLIPIAMAVQQIQDGVDIWVVVAAATLLIVFTFSRVWLIFSDLRTRESALEQTSAQLRTLIDTAPVAVIAADTEARITMWNKTAERMYGYTAEEVIGKHTPLRAQESADEVMGDFRQGRHLSREVVRRRKDGIDLQVMAVASPVTDESGRLRGVFTIHVDLSERNELEEKLRHSQKLEAVGQLAGGVAHDFNNLLTAISGYAELAALKATSDPELLSEIEQISRASDRAAALTRQLLAFSRKQVLTQKVIDLNELVSDVSTMLSRVIGSHIHLETDLAPGICPIFADPNQIEQVLINLAVNARDAMPDGGTVVVTTISHADATGEHITLQVRDTGTGMDDATRERVFEPFFTTKDVGKGTGLGLATVYGIVNQTNGTITLETELGVGTTFEIVFPAAKPETPTALPTTIATGGNERVLLVEDQPAVLSLTARLLAELGYTVVTAPAGDVAIEIAARERFDILVTDVVMPGLNGKELAAAITALQPGIPVLFTSGYPDQDLESRDITGAVALLRKPYTAESLAIAVRNTLDLRVSNDVPAQTSAHPARVVP